MKKLVSWVLVGMVSHSAAFAADPYAGSTVTHVWNALQPTPGETTPTAVVGRLRDFIGRSISADAKQTLDKKFDLFTPDGIAPRRKLAHPHGICFKGTWKIDTKSEFTGVFELGTEVPIIGRASEAMGYVNKGNTRAFGFAGKIFPGVDSANQKELDEKAAKTADFFTVDDLGGTKIDEYFRSSFTNEPPVSIGLTTSPNVLALGAVFAKTFRSADKQPGVRQLYPLSESGLANADDAVTPQHIRIVGGDFGRKQEEKDFRQESKLSNYENPVVLKIEVRKDEKGAFMPIGEIALKEDVISVACDEALHFHHPRWKE
jgi:hypothetical protein